MEQLKRLRAEKGLSQARLAARAELDPSTVNQIERGAREASPATLRKLAQALDVSLVELLEADSPKGRAPQLPLEDEQNQQRGWQSIVSVRVELLEAAAVLWEKQLRRGTYDLETLIDMDNVAFRLALNHYQESGEMERWCSPEQRERLDRAEEKAFEAARKVELVLLAELEELEKEPSQAANEKVADITRRIAQRERERREIGITA